MAPSVLPLTLWVLAVLQLSGATMDPGSYAPKTNQLCPQALLRQPPASNQTLSPSEVQYLADRRKSFPDAWRDWVGDGSHLGYDLDKLGITANNGSGLPIIAVASSGGGYRAAQLGAGVISGLDARNATAKAKGTGGLLQVSSYIAGLSGGSWLVSSMLFHDFPDMYDLVLGNTDKGGTINGWFLDKSLVLPSGINPFSKENQYFWGSLLWSVDDKGRTGLDTSLTDIWSRALSYHFLTGLGTHSTADTITTGSNFFTNDTSHGAGILWSDMKFVPTFQQREFPLPIVVTNVRPPGFAKLPPNTILFLNSTQYEFSPWEMGSYDPDLSAFIDVRFLGTHAINGNPPNSSACVTQFDQASFVFGTSSSLFNQLIDAAEEKLDQFDPNDSNALFNILRRMLNAVTTRASDVANYPNPFQGLNPGVFQDSDSKWIELIDGSTNKENIPLGPLLIKARHVDMIVGIDAGAEDPNDWPFGRSIYATRNRTQQVTESVAQQFPPVPNTLADFARLGINRRPTFFGCDPKQNPAEYPLLVWLPNQPPADGSDPVTNSGTFKLQYSTLHTSMFLSQAQAIAYDGFMEGQVGPDPEYPTCFQCAAIDRARLKTNPVTPRSDICSSCFKKYCYDPENPPPEGQIVGRRLQFKDPDPFFKSFYEHNKATVIVGGVIIVFTFIATFTGCAMFWRKRHQRKKAMASASAAYHQVARGEDAEWSTYVGRQSRDMAEARYSLPSYDYADAPYTAEPGYDTANAKRYSEEPAYGYAAKRPQSQYQALSDAPYTADPELEPGYDSANANVKRVYAPPEYPPPGRPHSQYQELSDATAYDPDEPSSSTPKAAQFTELRYDPEPQPQPAQPEPARDAAPQHHDTPQMRYSEPNY